MTQSKKEKTNGYRLKGRWTELVPVHNGYLPFLFELATSERTGFRWGIPGTMLRLEQFNEMVWTGAWCNFIVHDLKSNQPIGIVTGYQPNFPDGYAYVAQVMIEEVQQTGKGVEALGLFINLLFTNYNLRKLYFEVFEYNLPLAIGHSMREEGRLKDHTYFDGQWWDKIILALYRGDFEQLRIRLGRHTSNRALD